MMDSTVYFRICFGTKFLRFVRGCWVHIVVQLMCPSGRKEQSMARDLLVHNFIYDVSNLYTSIKHHQGYPALVRAGLMFTLK